MLVWTNTNTLEGLLDGIRFTSDPSEAEVALVGGKAFDLDVFPKLRAIFKTGVGRDNVPEAAAGLRGIVCAFPSAETCGIIFDETASFTCHLILRTLYAEVGDFGTWTKLGRSALQSKVLLVAGTGNIGSRVASSMERFMKVTTFDARTNVPEELEPLLRAADCVSVCLPLTPQTRGLFDAEKLGWMKEGACLVNTARAAIVDETALYEEVAAGRIRAAFDVFWKEPYTGRLLDLPSDRFIVTPHIASTCREFLAATAEDFRTLLEELERR